MSRNKLVENGIRDNLYGMPLDDILTPEQLSELEQKRAETVSVKKKKNKPEKKMLKPNKKMCMCAVGVLFAVVLLPLIKEPLFVRVASRIYAVEAIETTMDKAMDEAKKISEFLLGFDIFDANNINVGVSANYVEDSFGKLTDVSSDVTADVSFKSKEAVGIWQLGKSGENILNVSAYLNDDQAGVNFGNFFSEYWTFPARGFGEKWNRSGLKSVLYAHQTDDACDISFSNVFSGEFLSEQSERKTEKLLNSLLVSAKARYMGKRNVDIGDKTIKARKITFTFSGDELQTVLVPVAETVLSDSKFKSISDLPGRRELVSRIKQMCERIKNNIMFDRDICVDFFEYNGRIVSVSAGVGYMENMHDTHLDLELILGDRKSVLNNINVSVYIDNGTDNYSCNIVSSGYRGLKDKRFTDRTELKEVTGNYSREITNHLEVDYKNHIVTGGVIASNGDSQTTMSYTGSISKKHSAELVLDNITVSNTDKGITRTVLSKARISVIPKTVNKISVGSKKDILEMDKLQAETYIKKIVETEKFKKSDDCLKDVFGN